MNLSKTSLLGQKTSDVDHLMSRRRLNPRRENMPLPNRKRVAGMGTTSISNRPFSVYESLSPDPRNASEI
jgi:hypothetical protein